MDHLIDARFRDVRVPVIVLEHLGPPCPSLDPRKTAITELKPSGYTVRLGDEYEAGKGILWGVQDVGARGTDRRAYATTASTTR